MWVPAMPDDHLSRWPFVLLLCRLILFHSAGCDRADRSDREPGFHGLVWVVILFACWLFLVTVWAPLVRSLSPVNPAELSSDIKTMSLPPWLPGEGRSIPVWLYMSQPGVCEPAGVWGERWAGSFLPSVWGYVSVSRRVLPVHCWSKHSELHVSSPSAPSAVFTPTFGIIFNTPLIWGTPLDLGLKPSAPAVCWTSHRSVGSSCDAQRGFLSCEVDFSMVGQLSKCLVLLNQQSKKSELLMNMLSQIIDDV